MILPQLLSRFLRHGDDPLFYLLQARDAIRWLERKGVELTASTTALDLGCGHGTFGSELAKRGCKVTFADETNHLPPALASTPFVRVDLDRDDLAALGHFNLVVCSNVFEHLANPSNLLGSLHQLLSPNGVAYLSWTNWLSPWGGHDFAPFHYFGARWGPRLSAACRRRAPEHKPYENLYPTYIGRTLRTLRSNPHLRLRAAAPRYYTELAFLIRLPVLREFLTWNAGLLLENAAPLGCDAPASDLSLAREARPLK